MTAPRPAPSRRAIGWQYVAEQPGVSRAKAYALLSECVAGAVLERQRGAALRVDQTTWERFYDARYAGELVALAAALSTSAASWSTRSRGG